MTLDRRARGTADARRRLLEGKLQFLESAHAAFQGLAEEKCVVDDDDIVSPAFMRVADLLAPATGRHCPVCRPDEAVLGAGFAVARKLESWFIGESLLLDIGPDPVRNVEKLKRYVFGSKPRARGLGSKRFMPLISRKSRALWELRVGVRFVLRWALELEAPGAGELSATERAWNKRTMKWVMEELGLREDRRDLYAPCEDHKDWPRRASVRDMAVDPSMMDRASPGYEACPNCGGRQPDPNCEACRPD